MAYKQPYKSAILRVDPPDDPTSSFRQGVDRDQTRKEVRAEQKNKKKEYLRLVSLQLKIQNQRLSLVRKEK